MDAPALRANRCQASSVKRIRHSSTRVSTDVSICRGEFDDIEKFSLFNIVVKFPYFSQPQETFCIFAPEEFRDAATGAQKTRRSESRSRQESADSLIRISLRFFLFHPKNHHKLSHSCVTFNNTFLQF